MNKSSIKGRLERLFEDPTGKGWINNRIGNTMSFAAYDATDLNNQEMTEFSQILLLCLKKLAGVWNHFDRYCRLEDNLIEREKNKEIDNINISDKIFSDDLFLEFDEFLVQIKSSLDYLVKIPKPIVGKNHWNLRTFGDKGEKVSKELRNLTKEFKELAEIIIEKVINKNQPWLNHVIEARDKLNHYFEGCISFERFSVYKPNESEVVYVPAWSRKQSIRDFMKIVWWHLIFFVEDFIAFFLTFRMYPYYSFSRVSAKIETDESPWKLKKDINLFIQWVTQNHK